MKLQRTKNASRNITFGILYKIVGILGPFLVRTAMLYVMGTEYVGLNSLFTSVLSFLSLAELGVGNALVYSMYKPIAENDNDSICALLNLYKKLYRIIGFVILAIGLIILAFLPQLVSGDVPSNINLYSLYIIYLVNNLISYWLFGYKQSLLTAYQRSDIISKRSMAIQMAMYIIQIFAIIITHNYYAYIIWLPVSTLITNIVNSVITDRMFPNIKCRGEVQEEIRKSITQKVMALFGTKANAIVFHSADNLVISAFLGITIVGKYGNYYYILNAIVGVMTVLFSSLTAGLGNSLETETLDKNYKDFKDVMFLNAWIVTFCTVSLLCLYQPFMKIWVNESNMLPIGIVILLVIYFYVYEIRHTGLTYKDAAGIWWEDRFRPYVVMVTNIVLNVISVQFIGLYGVVLSTIVSMLISIPWETYTVFKYIFHRSPKEYYKKQAVYLIVAFSLCIVTFLLCYCIPDGIIGLIGRAAICVVMPNAAFVVLFYKTSEFDRVRTIFRSVLSRLHL